MLWSPEESGEVRHFEKGGGGGCLYSSGWFAPRPQLRMGNFNLNSYCFCGRITMG